MADDQEISEEYVLDMLKKDAEKLSSSYARSGTYDLAPKRPATSAFKPNTRFLKNIIRSTDNHNAALKRKELGAAAERLRATTREDEEADRKSRRDRDGDRAYADERAEARKRKKQENGDDDASEEESFRRRKRRNTSSSPERPSRRPNGRRDRSRSLDRYSRRSRRDRTSHRRRRNSSSVDSERVARDRSEDEEARSNIHSHRRDRKRDRYNHERRDRRRKDDKGNADEDNDADKKHHNSKRKRSRSRDRRLRSRSPRRDDAKSSSRADRHNKRGSKDGTSSRRSSTEMGHSKHDPEEQSEHQLQKQPEHIVWAGTANEQTQPEKSAISIDDDDDDDDPLAEFLGPKPAPAQPTPQIRGRGTTTYTSAASRFSATYDPTTDIEPTPTADEDWDQALEALRDRQRFRQAGADRLLAAGFSQEEIDRMERGGERDESDVRWRKKGEAREWDRGKKVDENGDVDFGSERFGRLT